MKLTQMIEKFAKQGMLNGVARAELLQAAEETEQEMAELQEELSGKDGELAENRKTAAVERAILVGGGMFGFAGMLLGAPIFAIVYALIKAFVDFRLEKRGLPRESARYINAPTSLNLKEEKK